MYMIHEGDEDEVGTDIFGGGCLECFCITMGKIVCIGICTYRLYDDMPSTKVISIQQMLLICKKTLCFEAICT